MGKNRPFFEVRTAKEFSDLALYLAHQHYEINPVYRAYCDLINRNPVDMQSIDHIPFLPIHFFKTHRVATFQNEAEKVFLSSSTTGQTPSKHYVKSLRQYEESFQRGFALLYGNVKDYTVLGLLPSYLERENSSLVYMVSSMINESSDPRSGFYLDEWDRFIATLNDLEKAGKKTLLIGVSFALLDLAEKLPFKLRHTIVMETGGMKGRRKEIVKAALHEQLCTGLGLDVIHAEYGMTELLSQAYSKGGYLLQCPPWLQVRCRSVEDPFEIISNGKSGALNFIDLANQNSCPFIATQDIGRCYSDHTFEVLGRLDHAEIRGCNLMVL